MVLDALAEKAHAFLKKVTDFDEKHDLYNNVLLQEAIEKGAFDPEIRKKILERDTDITYGPVRMAERLLADVAFSGKEIQEMIHNAREFQGYRLFEKYGVFLSVMMAKVMEKGDLVLHTKNTAPVFVPEYYEFLGKPSTSPSYHGLDKLREYYREHLLISYLASHLHKGKVKIIGNVGDFFGFENRGAEIAFEGETGWRPCYESRGGSITINGTAGHELGVHSFGGKIFVNGVMRSRGGYYTPTYEHEIYLNGKFLPKDDLSLYEKEWN